MNLRIIYLFKSNKVYRQDISLFRGKGIINKVHHLKSARKLEGINVMKLNGNKVH